MNKELFRSNHLKEDEREKVFVFNRIEKIEKYFPETKNNFSELIQIKEKKVKLKEVSLTEQLKDFSPEEKKVLLCEKMRLGLSLL